MFTRLSTSVFPNMGLIRVMVMTLSSSWVALTCCEHLKAEDYALLAKRVDGIIKPSVTAVSCLVSLQECFPLPKNITLHMQNHRNASFYIRIEQLLVLPFLRCPFMLIKYDDIFKSSLSQRCTKKSSCCLSKLWSQADWDHVTSCFCVCLWWVCVHWVLSGFDNNLKKMAG